MSSAWVLFVTAVTFLLSALPFCPPDTSPDSLCLFLIHLQDKEPRGIIPLENLCVREVPYPRKPVRSCQLAEKQIVLFHIG